VHKRSAALDTDALKTLERTELHREAAQLHAVVENQRFEIGRMLWDIFGQFFDADASEVEFGELYRSWGDMRALQKKWVLKNVSEFKKRARLA
jgi:hypothetical protein